MAFSLQVLIALVYEKVSIV